MKPNISQLAKASKESYQATQNGMIDTKKIFGIFSNIS
jgi:hypothetical protein